MALIKTRCCFQEQQRQQLFFFLFLIFFQLISSEKNQTTMYINHKYGFPKHIKPELRVLFKNSFCVAARFSKSWPYFRPCHFPHSIEVNKYNLWKASWKNLVVQEPAGRNLLFSQARSERMVLISELQLTFPRRWTLRFANL